MPRMAGVSKKRREIRKRIAKRRKIPQRDVKNELVSPRLDVDMSFLKGTKKSGVKIRPKQRNEPVENMLRRLRKTR